MPTLQNCSECGAALSASEQAGLCTRCLLGLALAGGAVAAVNPTPVASGGPDRGALPDDAPPADPSVRRFGDYELLEEIARGGMGVVYKARQRSLGRLVAVKMILVGSLANAQQVLRFRAEAAAAGSLLHPNIVAVHEVGLHEDQHFLVMDYVDGPNLSHFVGRQPLPAPRAARYLKAIADAIHAAHDNGILHRDLKPSNVLIDSASDQPRVTDFGLAKRFGVGPSDGPGAAEGEPPGWDLTLTGQVLGSPNFMAPEQAAGAKGKVGRATDVYGLGAILYHLLTARPPFQAESLQETLQQVAHSEPPSPRLLNPGVPHDLGTICLKCLEKDPGKRYPTARALAEELDRFLRDEPIHARPIGWAAKAWRWCRRKPALATFAGATALLLLVLSVGAPIVVFRIDRLRAAEQRNAQAEARERTRAEQSLYAAEMNLAQEALNEHNLARALRLLDRWGPAAAMSGRSSSTPPLKYEDPAGPRAPQMLPALRGWEWRYLRSRCHGDELATLTGIGTQHSERVVSVAFSPDGRWLASGSADGKVKLFDVPERREFAEIPHGAAVRAVAFSPRGSTLATLCQDNLTHLWNVATLLSVGKIAAHTEWAGGAIAFSTDGSMLAYSEPRMGWVTVTNFATHSAASFEAYANGYITGLVFSPDGRTLAARDPGMDIKFFNSGQEKHRLRHPHWGFSSMAFSTDGGKFVSTSHDRTAKVWESATGRLLHTFTHPISYPCAALFLSDGKTLAIANATHTITLWDSDAEMEVATLKGHQADVLTLALSPDGSLLASGSADGEVRLWNPERQVEKITSASLSDDEYYRFFAFSPDGRTFVASNRNQDFEIWDSATLTRTRTFQLDHLNPQGLAISSDGKRLASGGGATNGSVKLWRLDTTALQEEHSFIPSVGPIHRLELSPDGKVLAIVGRSIQLWNVEQRRAAHSFAFEDLRTLAFSPRGDWFAAAGGGRIIKVWSLNSGELQWERIAHADDIIDLAFFPDGRTLVSGGSDRAARLWEVESGRCLATLEGQFQGADSVAVSPDGRRVAVGSGEGTVRLWMIDGTESREVALLRCAGSLANPIAFLPDGNTLVARSFGKVQLWHAPGFKELEESEKQRRAKRLMAP